MVEGKTRELAISFEVAGVLTHTVKEGDTVKYGQVIAQLKNRIETLNVERLEAEHRLALLSLGRTKLAFQRNAANRHELDTDISREAILKAQLNIALEELARTYIKSPINGTILSVKREVGEHVTTGVPIVLVADLCKRKVRAFIEEIDALRATPGQEVSISSDGSSQTYAGKIISLSSRMGKTAPHSNLPGEYTDLYYREALIETDCPLPINYRVRVFIQRGVNNTSEVNK